jgi:hypothetical protein
MRIGKYEKELTRVLETAKGERRLHAYLKEHSDLVLRAFNTAWNSTQILSEFKVGTDFRADFLILSADSCSWHATFIELESHRARLYKSDGLATKALQVAQQQIKEWKDYVRQYEGVLRHQFSKVLRQGKVRAQCSVAGKFGSAAEEISDRGTVVHYHYHIVIGRSRSLSEDERRRRRQDCNIWGGMSVATYDRLLHFARSSDEAYRSQLQSWKKAGLKVPSTIRRDFYGGKPALVV